MIKHSLIDRLVSRIPHVELPNNPRNMGKQHAPRLPVLLHLSVQTFERAMPDGSIQRRSIGITYRRPIAKTPSKRDIHRGQVS